MKKIANKAQSLNNSVVIVLGASSGIGAATVQELVERGACVVLAARRIDLLKQQVDALSQKGFQVRALQTDVSDPDQLHTLVQQTIEQFGRIDAMINCAGMGWLKPLVESSEQEIEQVVAVNLLGSILAARAVLPHMLKRRHGALVFISSVSGHIAIDPLYSATKFGVRGFAQALQRELARTGVSVSLVSPGFIRTSMSAHMHFPMPGPEVVARTMADLVLHPRREVVVPLYYHGLIGAASLFPRLADIAIRRGRRVVVEPD